MNNTESLCESTWEKVMGPLAHYAWSEVVLSLGGWDVRGTASVASRDWRGRLVHRISNHEELWEWDTAAGRGSFFSIRYIP